jgi:hypothetical protein
MRDDTQTLMGYWVCRASLKGGIQPLQKKLSVLFFFYLLGRKIFLPACSFTGRRTPQNVDNDYHKKRLPKAMVKTRKLLASKPSKIIPFYLHETK